MTTIHNIASETEALLIDQMARDVRDDTDLGEEWRVIADLKNADWAASTIYDYLDRVIERARVLRVRDRIATGVVGGFAFIVGLATVCVGSLMPTEAHAATWGGQDWGSVGLRFLAFLACAAVIFLVVWTYVRAVFPKELEPEQDDYDTSDLERRRRNAGGE